MTWPCSGQRGAGYAQSIFDRGGDGKPARGQLLPAQYNRDSILTFTVPAGGTAEANFDLLRGHAPPNWRGWR
jgi:hypothetical protein